MHFARFALPLHLISDKEMEKKDELRLWKIRSTAGVVSDGYRLYASKFRLLLRSSWLAAILYGLAFAWLMSTLIYHVLPLGVAAWIYGWEAIDWHSQTPALCKIAASMLTFLFTALLMASYGLHGCRCYGRTGQFPRAPHWWGALPPLKSLSLLLKGFKWLFPRGLRHLGLLLVVGITTGIVTSVLTVVCEFPAFIIAIANIEAYAGLTLGDELIMPPYLPWLTFGIFTLAGFVQAYVHLYTVFPPCYAYTSIEVGDSTNL